MLNSPIRLAVLFAVFLNSVAPLPILAGTLDDVTPRRFPVDDPAGGGGDPRQCDIGKLPGDFLVDGFGQAHYSIPIDVPPGTRSLKPDLALKYESLSGNGHLGVAWKIEGLSAITRCGASLAEDGYMGGAQNNMYDRFCLDGVKLVAIAGDYGVDGTEYRTNPDRVMRIKSFGWAGANYLVWGPQYFTVETKDGLTLEYGGNAIADQGRIEESSSDLVRTWALSRMTDKFGNYIDFRYGENRTNGEYWIDEIWYTGHCSDLLPTPTPTATPIPPPTNTPRRGGGKKYFYMVQDYQPPGGDGYSQGMATAADTLSLSTSIPPTGCQPFVAPYNRVKFYYDDGGVRPDVLKGYAGGSAANISKRLTRIETSTPAGPNPVSRYTLTYETSQGTYLSRLKSIAKCGADGLCLPPTVVNWSDPLNGELSIGDMDDRILGGTGFGGAVASSEWWFADSPEVTAATLSAAGMSAGIRGATAAVMGGTPGGGPSVSPHFSRNGGDGRLQTTISVKYGAISYSFGHTRHDLFEAIFGDFNGDGRTDVVQVQNSGNAYVSLAQGSGTEFTLDSQGLWGSGLGLREEVRLGDFNGDGKTDLIQIAPNDNSYVNLSTGSSFSAPGSFVASGTGPIANVHLADMNGDGKTDLLRFPAPEDAGDPILLWTSTGSSFNGPTTATDLSASTDRVIFGDFDGDGLTDLLMHDPNGPYGDTLYSLRSNGSGYIYEGLVLLASLDLTEHAVIQSGDFNGDGKADLVIFDRDRTFWDPTYSLSHAYFYLSNGESALTDSALNQSSVMWVRAAHLDYTETNLISGGSGAITRDGVPSAYNFRSRIADFNGDGRADILNFDKGDDHIAHLRLSRGDSWQKIDNFMQSYSDKLDEMSIADFDGDGRADIAQTAREGSNPIYAWFNDKRPVNDKVVTIMDGLGKTVTIGHQPLTQLASCSSAAPIGTDPLVRNFLAAMYVVSDYAISDGLGGAYAFSKDYTCPRYSLNYGFLGYDTVQTIDVPRDIRTITYYYQTFPRTGLIQVENRWIPSDVIFQVFIDKSSTYQWNWDSFPGSNGASYARLNLLSESILEKEMDGVVALDRTTTYTYDDYQNVLQKESIDEHTFERITNTYQNQEAGWSLGLPIQTDYLRFKVDAPPQSYGVTRVFDSAHMVAASETTAWTAGAANKSLTRAYDYDDFGNVLSATTTGTDVLSRSDTYVYDGIGQFLTTQINALGQSREMTFDGRFGRPSSMRDLNNLETNYGFDSLGRTVSETRPDGTSTIVSFCAEPGPQAPPAPALTRSVVKVTSSGAPDREFYFDALGREIMASTQGFDGSPILEHISYSPMLNVSAQSMPRYVSEAPYWTNYQYDVHNRVRRIDHAGGAVEIFAYAGGAELVPSSIISTTPSRGRTVTRTSSPNDRTTLTVFDEHDRAIQVQERPTSQPATLLASSTYFYDAGGNIHKIADAAENVTTVTWDNNNNPMSVSDPDSGLTTLTYNALGELMSKADAIIHTNYSFDKLGRLRGRYEVGADEAHEWIWDSAPNGVGHLASMFSRGVLGNPELMLYEATYTYDSLSRPSTVSMTVHNLPYPNPPLTLSAAMSYDALGRLGTLSYPGTIPFNVAYGYTASGYLNSVTRPATGDTYWQATAQSARNQVSDYTLGNGMQVAIDYEPAMGNPTQILSSDGVVTVQNSEYEYDELGRLTRRMSSVGGAWENINYDPLSRVVSVTTGNNSWAYPSVHIDYDQIGNIIYKSDVGTYTYGGGGFSGGPHAVSQISGVLNSNFSYDISGNMYYGLDASYDWTGSDQVRRITVNSGYYEYQYDGSGNKVYRNAAVPGGSGTFYLGKIFELEGFNPASPIEERRIIYAGAQAVALHKGSNAGPQQVQYLHADRLGSIEAVSGPSAGQIEQLSYDVFGRRRDADFAPPPGNGSYESTRGFTGHEMLDDLELVEMQARIYNPSIGRFLSADPLSGPLDNTQALNRYSYVWNDPANLVDPTGMQVEGVLGDAAADAVGGTVASTLATELAVDTSAQVVVNELANQVMGYITTQAQNTGIIGVKQVHYAQDSMRVVLSPPVEAAQTKGSGQLGGYKARGAPGSDILSFARRAALFEEAINIAPGFMKGYITLGSTSAWTGASHKAFGFGAMAEVGSVGLDFFDGTFGVTGNLGLGFQLGASGGVFRFKFADGFGGGMYFNYGKVLAPIKENYDPNAFTKFEKFGPKN